MGCRESLLWIVQHIGVGAKNRVVRVPVCALPQHLHQAGSQLAPCQGLPSCLPAPRPGDFQVTHKWVVPGPEQNSLSLSDTPVPTLPGQPGQGIYASAQASMCRPTGQPSVCHFLCNSHRPGPFHSSALFHRGALARHLWSRVLSCLLSHLIIIAILGHQQYSLFTGEPTEAQRNGAICLRSGSSQVASPRGSGAGVRSQHPPH